MRIVKYRYENHYKIKVKLENNLYLNQNYPANMPITALQHANHLDVNGNQFSCQDKNKADRTFFLPPK